MPAFADVQKPAGKQNIFPKIPGAGSANLIHTHEILRKQCLAATTGLLISTHQRGGSCMSCKALQALQISRPDMEPVPVSCSSHTALNLLGPN